MSRGTKACRRSAWLVAVLAAELVIGSAVVAWATTTAAAPTGGASPLGFWPMFLLCLAAALVLALVLASLYYAALAVHEAGHLAAGGLVGFRFVFVQVGPARLDRRGGRLRLSLATGSPSLGFASILPTDDRHLRRRYAAMIAGGPVASLLLTLAAGGSGIGLIVSAPLGGAGRLVGLGLFGLGLASAFLLLLSLLPFQERGVTTDGLKLLTLALGGPRADRLAASVALAGALQARGVRPRDLDPALIARSLEPADGTPQEVEACLLAYAHALDRGDRTAAGTFVDRAIAIADATAPASRPSAYRVAAFFAAFHRGDAVAARAFLDRCDRLPPPAVGPDLRPLAEAAILIAERRHGLATARIDAELARVGADPGLAADLRAVRAAADRRRG